MGRKKKKTTKPWCWYCNREFEDEKILLQHQKAKHFKCHICHKKLFTGPGLQIHCMQVHKENIEKVPNSIKGRDNITLEICGMENIPEEDLIEHEKQKTLNIVREDDSDSDTEGYGTSYKPPYPPAPQISQVPKPLSTGYQHPPLPSVPPPLPPPPPGSVQAHTNPMMQQMMMMYPQMAHMMAANPMMMNQMMNLPQQQPPPMPPTQPPPPPPSSTQQPKPLMSLMGVNTKSSYDTSTSNLSKPTPKPLFPSAAEFSEVHSHLNDQYYVPKVESAPPGSKIVHPEEDISLEEFRASHHKYKYIAPQYSAPALPNPTSTRPPHQNPYQNPMHHYQHRSNGNGY